MANSHLCIFPIVQLGPNVFVGAGVRIEAGARVRESIILDRAELKVGDHPPPPHTHMHTQHTYTQTNTQCTQVLRYTLLSVCVIWLMHTCVAMVLL